MLFRSLSRLVIAFLPRTKCLLISWQQSPSAVILEPKKIVCHCFLFFTFYLPLSDGTGCHDLSFLNVEFQTSFSLSSFTTSSRGSLVSLHFLLLSGISIFHGGSDDKESAHNTGDSSLIPGLGRSPGVGNGNPLPYACLENSVGREAR